MATTAAAVPGKSAADYARDLESSDQAIRREAAYQLSLAGREARMALPQLIQALGDEQQQVWFGAITALTHLGPDAEPALPALLQELEKWQPFGRGRQGSQALYRTAMALGAIGPAAVPALSNALTSRQWHVRAGAAMALGQVGPAASPVQGRLLELLGDDRGEVREAVAETLAVQDHPPVDALVSLLHEAKAAPARQAAADTLRRIGSGAELALPALREALTSDPDEAVRVEAVQAVGRISGREAPGLAALMEAWRGGTEAVRATAQRELLLVRRPNVALVPALVSDLRSTDGPRRRRAAVLIAELGPAASTAAAPLADALRAWSGVGDQGPDPLLVRGLAATGERAVELVFDDLARVTAAEDLPASDWRLATLRSLGTANLPWVVPGLGSAGPAVRWGALEALGAWGAAASEAAAKIPACWEDSSPAVRAAAWRIAIRAGVEPAVLLAALDRGLKDPVPAVRGAVLEGVAGLGPDARPAMEALLMGLDANDSVVRRAAVRGLATLGPGAAEAVEPLSGLLAIGSRDLQVEVLDCLGRIGGPGVAVLPRLKAFSGSPDPTLRRAYVAAVGRWGAAAQEALGDLNRRLVDEDAGVRAATVRAMVRVRPEDEGTVSALVEALDDPAPAVRRAAIEGLGTMGERGRPAELSLFALLSGGEDREAVVEALRTIKPQSVEALSASLESGHEDVRLMAVEALAGLGAEAREVAPKLERLQQEDPSDDVKRAARRALRRVR